VTVTEDEIRTLARSDVDGICIVVTGQMEEIDRLRAEVARLQGEVEQAEREAQSERDDARNVARFCGEVEAERNALRARVETLDAALEGLAWAQGRAGKCWCQGGPALAGHYPSCEAARAALRGGKGEP
jgi:hypothetical protein